MTIKKLSLLHSLFLYYFLTFVSTPVHAQITPDDTLREEASKLNQNVPINGANADLINGGAQRGNNLFHSFSEFNIKDGQRVYFGNPSGVVNILTRVTGKNASNILGTLGVDGGANLFLINPNGILFGKNASLDVRGSFVGTTANGVQFGNQGNFSTTNPEAPGLLTINPSALFFNQINPNAAIVNNSVAPLPEKNPAGFDVFGLRVPDGKSLLLVGGNVNMDGGQLNAYGGRVELGGLASPGEISLQTDENNFKLAFPENVTRADVSLNNGARVYVEASEKGSITFNARNIDILGESLLSAGIGSGLGSVDSQAGDITLNATGKINISQSSQIRNIVNTDAIGNAGNVTVTAKENVELAGASILSTVEAGGVGKGGNININAANMNLTDGAQLLTIIRGAANNQPAGKGDAGNVNVKVAGVVNIAGVRGELKSGIASSVGTGTEGNGGNITIDAGSFKLVNGARLSASTFGKGSAGNVTVTTKENMELAGASIFSTVEAGGVGKGGNININAANMNLTDGTQLTTATRGAENNQPAGKGDAGNVNVKVAGVVNIAGAQGEFVSGIFSSVNTGTEGNGGNITIDAGSFKLVNGTQLAASTSGKGNAGNVTVTTKENVELAGAGILSAVDAGGVGKGGDVNINAANLYLTDGAQLVTVTRGAGNNQPAGKGDAGNVNIKVAGVVNVGGVKNGRPSGIFSSLETGTEGNGGNITIDAGSFKLVSGARLLASTFGKGNAGNVTVTTKENMELAGAAILSTVEAGGVGKGGDININAANMNLTDGAQLVTITRRAGNNQPAGKGDAGNVNIKVAGVVDIAGAQGELASGIFSAVDTGTEGNGGNITIDAGSFKLVNGAILAASTLGKGNAGNIIINATDALSLSGINQNGGFSTGLYTGTASTSTGTGGDITLNTNTFQIANGATVDAGTANNQKGGDITINANVIEAIDGGLISTTTSSNGSAGKVTVNAADQIIIDGFDPNYNNRVAKFSLEVVGNISANSGIFVSSTGSGTTGDIEINSPKVTLNNQGKLQAEGTSGNGGNIKLNSNLLLLRRGAQISTNAGTAKLGGDGGNIDIDSDFIVAVPTENSDITANAFTGKGGNVFIRAQGIFGIEPTSIEFPLTSDITASSESGIQGQISINDPDVEPAQGLIELPEEVVDATRRVTQICPRVPGAKPLGEFTITGRGSLPPSPLEPLSGATNITKLATLDNNTSVSNTAPKKVQNAIVEAQGWVKNQDGSLELVAQAPDSTPNARVVASACPTN